MKILQFLVAAAALVSLVESTSAQEQSRATLACWETLAPVDTVREVFEVHVEEHRIWRDTNLAGLSTDYLTSVAAAIAAHMRVPAQMESPAFSVDMHEGAEPDFAKRVTSAAATYSPLPGDRFASIQLYGVGANQAMERALAQAISDAHSAGEIPPLPAGAYPPDLLLEIAVGSRRQDEDSPDTLDRLPAHAGASRPIAVGHAFVERYRLDQAVVPRTSTQRVPYPAAARQLRADGTVTMEFIVDEAGKVVVDRAILRSADRADFARAVAKALPQMRFRPAQVGACRLPTVVRQSFVFGVRR
ncbi:hypothetical protein BH23GEM1_BH23GEM1_05940 [soil metagenome]